MPDNRDFLIHYGVKGQKKGVRRYQNEDMSLTPEGREHYGIGQGKLSGYRKTLDQTKQVVNRAATIVKNRTQGKISEIRGPKHMSDEELNARIKRLRSESEYMRLQREVNGGGNQNGGGGKKGGDKKHPYLAKAVALPIAAAIGVGVSSLAKEKVDAFLDHRAATKLSDFMRSAKTSTNANTLSKLLESARRSAETAKHPMQGIPNVKDIVSANVDKFAQKQAFKDASKVGKKVIDALGRTSLDNPRIKRRLTASGW